MNKSKHIIIGACAVLFLSIPTISEAIRVDCGHQGTVPAGTTTVVVTSALPCNTAVIRGLCVLGAVSTAGHYCDPANCWKSGNHCPYTPTVSLTTASGTVVITASTPDPNGNCVSDCVVTLPEYTVTCGACTIPNSLVVGPVDSTYPIGQETSTGFYTPIQELFTPITGDSSDASTNACTEPSTGSSTVAR